MHLPPPTNDRPPRRTRFRMVAPALLTLMLTSQTCSFDPRAQPATAFDEAVRQIYLPFVAKG